MFDGLSGNSLSNMSSRSLLSKKATVTCTLFLMLIFYGEQTFLNQLPYYRDLGALLLGMEEAARIIPWPKLWNPYAVLGRPFAADLLSGVYYPPLILFRQFPLALGFNLDLIFHHILAMWGVFALLRAWDSRRLGALAAGIVFSFGGYVVSGDAFPNALHSCAWLPWAMFSLIAVVGCKSGKNIVALAFSLVMILLGAMPEVLLAFILCIPFVISLDSRTDSNRKVRDYVVSFIFALLLALLLSAVQLIPFLEYLSQSSRAGGLDSATVLRYSVAPLRLYELVIPPIKKLGLINSCGTMQSADLLCATDHWAVSIYIGIALILVFPGFLTLRQRSKIIGCLTIIFSLVVSFGGHFSLIVWLVDNVPLFKVLRYPEKLLLVPHFLACLMIGFGVSSIEQCGENWNKIRFGFWVWLGVGLSGVLMYWRISAPHMTSLILVFLCWAASLLLILRYSACNTFRAARLLVILVATDLIVAHRMLLPVISVGDIKSTPMWARGLSDQYVRIYANGFGTETKVSSREDFIEKQKLGFAGLPMLYGIANLNMPSSITSDFDELLMSTLESLEKSKRGAFLLSLGVNFVTSVVPLTIDGFLELGREGEGESVQVLRAEAFTPRFFVPEKIIFSTPDSEIRKLKSLQADEFLKTAIVSGFDSGDLVGAGELSEISMSPGSYSVNANMTTPGLLVLREAFFEGWKWTVDNKDCEVLEVSRFFQGCKLSAGFHKISVTYNPANYNLGLVVSAFGLLICGLLLYYRRSSG